MLSQTFKKKGLNPSGLQAASTSHHLALFSPPATYHIPTFSPVFCHLKKKNNKQNSFTPSICQVLEMHNLSAQMQGSICLVNCFSHVWLFPTLWTIALQAPLWDSPGKNTRVGCHALLQGIFPAQGSKLRLVAGGFFSTPWQASGNAWLWGILA